MNAFAILNIIGMSLLFTAVMLVFPTTVALWYGEDDITALVITSGIALGGGLPTWWLFRKHRVLKFQDGFIIVIVGWLLVTTISALPFFLHGSIPSYTDAFFETMSGFTTTGATILSDIEALPHGLLFWRSMTQFVGGMGIIMLIVLIIPLLGIDSLSLYRAEAAPGQGPDSQKFLPRMKDCVKWLWIFYISMTLFETVLLLLGGMSLFDALCHAFSSFATAGYSTKNASLGHYDSAYFDWVVIIFMYLGGINFILYYNLIKKDYTTLLQNTELRWYTSILILLCSTASYLLWKHGVYTSLTDAFRYGTFQVVSILTTTGYITADYELWPNGTQGIIFVCMFLGACAGSTTSGIKIVQLVILCKYLYAKMIHIVQPLAINPIRLSGHRVDSQSVDAVLGFFIINIFIVIGGSLVMTILSDMDIFSAFMSVVATVWNIGPSFGTVGAVDNYGHISDAGKWFLSFNMLVGRLEVFTALVIFTPYFWKR
ncbi:MAG: TrkH family potassium uptake protein [SAR324 cluster bacterium]|nr:TrkH family potassium uptake protein [SAR324 cluster bacterium]